MKDLKLITVSPESTILETLEVIDRGLLGIALVVDQSFKLIGTVTDGDIRRAIIKKVSLYDTIDSIMSRDPVKARVGTSPYQLISIMKSKVINQIPVVDPEGRLVDIKTLAELIKGEDKDNYLVIMAGGLGTRLRPFTHTTPKPLLPIGNKPILESIIDHAKTYGLTKIIISLNYLSESIQNYFGDGSNFGVNISYINEKDSLGTAGALSLIEKEIISDIFVINGDILTRVDFDQMLEEHISQQNKLTTGIRTYKTQIPYGIVKLEEKMIKELEEKPVLEYYINAGIYILSPPALKRIPLYQTYHMTDLINDLLEDNRKVGSFLINDYWLDVGKINDYYRANFEFSEYFV
jgi:dTDP-glucose pyrophosphorylase